MKTILKGAEPEKLASYRHDNPQGSWANCKKNKKRHVEIRHRLLADQGGLCAYCEIDLLAKTELEEADFRVEHFHPKSDKNTGKNWGLDWGNLLACCHGGSQRNVVDAENRFSSPDNSCDVPKRDKGLTGLILNPLQLPAFPNIFQYSRSTGKMTPHSVHCQAENINFTLAQKTIDKLRLNANRLNRLRKPVLDKQNDELRKMIAQGDSIESARERLAKAYLVKNSDDNWPKFFSALRSYLGTAAENQLEAVAYKG